MMVTKLLKMKEKMDLGQKNAFLAILGPNFFFYATPIYRGGKHYENFRVPQILLVESIFRCFGQKITPVGRFWVPFQQYQKFGFPYYRAKKKVVVNFIYGYQNLSGEKYKTNGNRAQSDVPVRRKIPKTIRKYHFPILAL